MTEPKKPRPQKIIDRVPNNRGIAIFLIVAVCLMSLGTFVDSILKRRTNIGKLTPIDGRKVQFDQVTHEKLLDTKILIKDFLLRLKDEPNDVETYAQYEEDYRIIEVELRNLLLTSKSRPLNEGSTEQIDIFLKQWLKLKRRHRNYGNFHDFSSAQVDEVHKLIIQMIDSILTNEISKISASPN